MTSSEISSLSVQTRQARVCTLLDVPRRNSDQQDVSLTARRGLAAGAALTLLAIGLAGCGKPLFSERDERSQFDRYDRVRNKFAPQYVYDEFGREQPNLRGRLTPKR